MKTKMKTMKRGKWNLKRGWTLAYDTDPDDGDLELIVNEDCYNSQTVYYTPADVRKLRDVCDRYLAITEANKKAAALAKTKAKARTAGKKAKTQ